MLLCMYIKVGLVPMQPPKDLYQTEFGLESKVMQAIRMLRS